MLTIMIGDRYVHNPQLKDNTRLVLAPHLRAQLNRPDVLTFTLPPNNMLFGQIQKRKDVVRVIIDDEEIFYGQMIDERPGIDNMREYTCEGMLSFLADSIKRPYKIEEGTEIPVTELFKMLIEHHNAQVDPEKQFAIGIVNATDKLIHTDSTDYATTLHEINLLCIGRYGGFLRVRRENGINYIDWLKELTDVSTQAVEFGKNIIDIDGLIDSREIGSVLVPLGARLNGKKLTIESVNGGSDSIESEALIQKYGRVVLPKDFPTVKDANELLEKGREALAEMEDDETFDITAVDLRRLGVDVTALRVGLLTPIRAPRQGIDKSKIIYVADMDLENIENSVYTFGVPRQTLTEAIAETTRRGGSAAQKVEELSDIIIDAYIDIDRLNGEILLRAYAEEMNVRFSEAWIELDGVNAEIRLKADVETVDALGTRVSAAEIAIDGANSEIRLKADKTYVDSLFAKSITADTLSANLASLESIQNNSIQGITGDFETVQAQGVVANASVETKTLTVNGLAYNEHSHAVSVNDDGTITLGEVSSTGGNFKIADTKVYKDGVSAARTAGANSVTLSASGWTNGTNTVTASNGKTKAISLPAFTASGGTTFTADHKTTVYFSTESVSTPLASATIDASSVYQAGYNAGAETGGDTDAAYNEGYEAGWKAAAAYATHYRSSQKITIRRPSASIVDAYRADDVYTVSPGGSIDSIRNTAANTFFATGVCKAFVSLNGGTAEQVASVTKTKTQTINVGQ